METRQAHRTTAMVSWIISYRALESQCAHTRCSLVNVFPHGRVISFLLSSPLQRLSRPLQLAMCRHLPSLLRRIPLQKGDPLDCRLSSRQLISRLFQTRMQCGVVDGGGRSIPKSPRWVDRCDGIVPYTWRAQTSKGFKGGAFCSYSRCLFDTTTFHIMIQIL